MSHGEDSGNSPTRPNMLAPEKGPISPDMGRLVAAIGPDSNGRQKSFKINNLPFSGTAPQGTAQLHIEQIARMADQPAKAEGRQQVLARDAVPVPQRGIRFFVRA